MRWKVTIIAALLTGINPATLVALTIAEAASMLVFATLFGTELGVELLGLLLQNADDNSLNVLQAYQNIF